MYKKHEDVYIDMIYSLRCCDPCEITSQKFYTYVCTYVCASVCPALNPPPLSSLLHSSSTSHSIYLTYLLTFFLSSSISLYSVFQIITISRSIDEYVQRTIDCTFFLLYFCITVSVRVELA